MFFGERLDALAQSVFAGEAGRARVAPLLERFDRRVGAPRADDADPERLHAVRVDWALCDASITDGMGAGMGAASVGDTWARRAAAGLVPGVEPHEDWARLASSVARVFEMWPGRPTLARDVLGGLLIPLAEPVVGLEEQAGHPAALWELRVVLGPDGAHTCRPAIDYPLDLLDELARRRDTFPTDPDAQLGMLQRARLNWVRSGRRARFRLG